MISLLYGSGSGAGVLVIDATLTETHAGDVDITQHPVETGSDITDHVRQKPATLKLEGVLVDAPLPVAGKQGSTGPAAQKGRANAQFLLLCALRDTATLIDVTTGLREYKHTLIESISTTRVVGDGDSLKFSASLREVRLVASQLVAITRTSLPAAKAKVAGGKQTGTAATRAERRASILERAAEAGGLIQQQLKGPPLVFGFD